MELSKKELFREIKACLPADFELEEIRFEGSEIVLYTRNKEYFARDLDFIRKLVSKLKKRIVVKPHISIAKPQEVAEKVLRERLPESGRVRSITFLPEFTTIIVEAERVGDVVGRRGELVKSLKRELCWDIKVRRAPLIESEVVKTVREIEYKEAEFRKNFLNKVGSRIFQSVRETEWIRLTALGGFREVGRSCLLLQTPESRVLIDCGIKPGTDEFPYLNVPEFDINSIDGIVVSHAHLDHCGLIPYLYEFGYEGPLYCTPPTRDLMLLLWMDYLELLQRSGKKAPFTTKGIREALKRTIVIPYNEVNDITPDMKLTFYNAGHILGSAIVHIHIGDGMHNVIYTGDFKFERTSLFDPAFTDFVRCETVITESTYGTDKMPRRKEAEKMLMENINKVMERNGKVLIPVFAVGRAQDIMVILAKNGFEYPVYLDGMLYDALAIHTAYPEFMSREIQRMILKEGFNPFLQDIFKRVGSSSERKEVAESEEPCVVLATSGMLTGGPAMEYLKYLAESEKNMLMFVGYQAEGTLGRRIQKGWKEIPMEIDGKNVPVKIECEVVTVEGLSGHSDRRQIISFFRKLKQRPHRIICNHGESAKCVELAKTLSKILGTEAIAPRNLETIRLL